MSDTSDGQKRMIWARMIKQNMMTVHGSKSIFRLNNKKGSVEIHVGPRPSVSSSPRYGQPPKVQPAVGQRNVTLDVSSPDFLILSRHPTVMQYKHYIPWKRIVEIVFRNA